MKIIPPLAEHTTQAGAWRRGIVAALEKFMPLFEQYEQKEKELANLLLR